MWSLRDVFCWENNIRLCENVSCLQMGAYHTIDLELNRKFTLLKEHWDLIALDRVGKHGV